MFNHKGNVSAIQINGRPYLRQDGMYFTHAEYNRGLERWIPEPQEIAEIDVMAVTMQSMVSEVLDILKKLLKTQNKVMDEFAEKAAAIKREREKAFQRLNGENSQLKMKVKKLEDRLEEIDKQPDPPKTTDEKLLDDSGMIVGEEGVMEV